MNNEHRVLTDGGQMGALMRVHRWSESALGPVANWAPELQAMTRFVLASPQPMMIWWGDANLQIYNDAFALLMGPERHPKALGAPASSTWAEVWDLFEPQAARVLAGEQSHWHDEELIHLTRHGRRREVWWSYGFMPIRKGDGVGGVVLTCHEMTARHRLTHRMRQQSERFQQLFEQAPGFIAVLFGPNHVFQLANTAYRELVGNRPLIGHALAEVLPEASAQGFLERLDEVYRTGVAHVGNRVPLRLVSDEGKEKNYVLDFVYQPVIEDDGEISGIFVQGHDVTAHVEAERNLILINNELKHRVKNTLAVITGIVNQTLRNSDNDELLMALRDRIRAYARAHDILAPQTWATGTVRGAVISAVQAFQAQGGRFHLDGPDLTLGSRQVLSLALAVHELAVNAKKFGALSSPSGRVDIRWALREREHGPEFEFFWEESGGPEVSEPRRQGFGLNLVSRVLAGDFDATTTISFPHTGMRFKMLALAPALRPPDPEGFFAKL